MLPRSQIPSPPSLQRSESSCRSSSVLAGRPVKAGMNLFLITSSNDQKMLVVPGVVLR